MRDKYPEKVPFRLTRMLIKAMEVSGIEGSYRSTCEQTMTVLRESRESLIAMLEAFVYDPLISWRLIAETAKNNPSDEHVGEIIGASSSAHGTPNPLIDANESGMGNISGAPIDLSAAQRTNVIDAPITEGQDEDGDDDGDEDDDGESNILLSQSIHESRARLLSVPDWKSTERVAMSAAQARSLQMYSNIQTWAANLNADPRIASITGDERSEQIAISSSIARSRVERSFRHREKLGALDEDGLAHDEALNEKALEIIRRVQDKLTGTDFEDRDENGDPFDVVDQVQRLIVQATSVENLSQLFIGWCAFW